MSGCSGTRPDAMYAALVTADRHERCAPGASVDLSALLDHGVSLRSRGGAGAATLGKTVPCSPA
ncbi:hypothetical protein U5640_37325 [Streptomyces sp. SS7]|uniref:hypothetical protein n=1 Tax=Streptomyces sp. SS7 TaxID=3108485 RepID=UPI0030EE9EF8